jgi:hypothetical protein
MMMDKWLKLHIFKTFLNACVRIANFIIPRVEPTWPQSRILRRSFARMRKAFAVEAYCGRFDDVPYQTVSCLRDKHFLRVLDVSEKLLLYLGEMDRYYRQWLGVAFLLAEEEMSRLRESMTYEEFLSLVKAQWEFDMTGAFPREYFEAHRDQFLKILLANSLVNLT